MPFSDYFTDPALNVTIGDDIFIGPNMERAAVRPALQQFAADGKDLADTVTSLGATLNGAVAQLEVGLTVTSATGQSVSTRSMLAAIASPIHGQVAFFDGSTWEFSTANLSANVTLDTQQGIYVAPTVAPTGASGAWVRNHDGRWSAAWFGAQALNGAFDNGPAIRGIFNALKIFNGTTITRNLLPEIWWPPSANFYDFQTGEAHQPNVVCEVANGVRMYGMGNPSTLSGTLFRCAAGKTMFSVVSITHPNSGHGFQPENIVIYAAGKTSTTANVTAMTLGSKVLTVDSTAAFSAGDVILLRGMGVRKAYRNRGSGFLRNRAATTNGSNRITFPIPHRFRGGEVVSVDGAGFAEGSFIQLVGGLAENTEFDLMKLDATGATVASNATATVAAGAMYIWDDFCAQVRSIDSATQLTLADTMYAATGVRGISAGAGDVLRRKLERYDCGIYTECKIVANGLSVFDFKGAGIFGSANSSMKSREDNRDTNCNESKIYGEFTSGNCRNAARIQGSDANGWYFDGFNGRQSDSWCFVDASGTGARLDGAHVAGTLGVFVAQDTAKVIIDGYKETGTWNCLGLGTQIRGTGWGSTVDEQGGASLIVDDDGRMIMPAMRVKGSSFSDDWTIGDRRLEGGVLRYNGAALGYSTEFHFMGLSDYYAPGVNNGLQVIYDANFGAALMAFSLNGAVNGAGKVYFPSVQLGNGGNIAASNFRDRRIGTAAPTTGSWVRGDKVENSAPAVGSPLGWICTVSGTPGTWVPLPTL